MATAGATVPAPGVGFGGNGATYGPFAGRATAFGLSWLATLLYIDAIISPGGTGLLYVGTSSRVSFALARNRYIHAGSVSSARAVFPSCDRRAGAGPRPRDEIEEHVGDFTAEAEAEEEAVALPSP